MPQAFSLVCFTCLIATLLFSSTATAQRAHNAPSVHYTKGMTLQDGHFQLKARASVQVRYEQNRFDQGNSAENRDGVYLRRTRLVLTGGAFDPNLTWKFQYSFDSGSTELKDALVDYRLVPQWLHLKAGQDKLPFSRHFLNSGFSQELIDRSITHDGFVPGRDLGVWIHNNGLNREGLEYAFSLSNGSGDKARFRGTVDLQNGDLDGAKVSHRPETTRPALTARVGYNLGKIKGYSEGDLEGGGLRAAVGAAGHYRHRGNSDEHVPLTLAEIDAVLKIHGLSLSGAWYYSKEEQEREDLKKTGYYVQSGYLFKEHYQPSVRYSRIDYDHDSSRDEEFAAGFNLYFYGHDFKWQIDYAVLRHKVAGAETNDGRFRTQLELVF